MNRPYHHWCGRKIMCDECWNWERLWMWVYDVTEDVTTVAPTMARNLAEAYRPEGL